MNSFRTHKCGRACKSQVSFHAPVRTLRWSGELTRDRLCRATFIQDEPLFTESALNSHYGFGAGRRKKNKSTPDRSAKSEISFRRAIPGTF